MLHVAFARSAIARGKILSIDTDAARAVPGVRAVYTMDDLIHLNIQMVSSHMIVPPPGTKVYPLAKDRVAHVGDPVAMVIAETRYIAEDAAILVAIECEEEDPVVTIAQAKEGIPVHPDVPNNIAAAMTIPHPELEQALATAPHLVTGTVKHQR